MKAVVATFNQEKALVGAFSVIVQPVVEPMDRFAALITTLSSKSKGFSDDGGEIRHILPFKKIQIYNDTMGFGLIFNWSR